ncbi:MAG: SEL1-like repeat protein [Hyphomicrobiaceae bacterium]
MARLNLNDVADAGILPAATSAEALFELGLMYSAGRDVEPDMITAHKWFNLAALRGSERAKAYRMELSREMSKREIAEAQRQAREWLKRH